MFLSFHSYGQFFLYPWSYSLDDSPDKDLHHEIFEIAAASVKKVHGTEYVPQKSFELCKLMKDDMIFKLILYFLRFSQITTMALVWTGFMDMQELPFRLL